MTSLSPGTCIAALRHCGMAGRAWWGSEVADWLQGTGEL